MANPKAEAMLAEIKAAGGALDMYEMKRLLEDLSAENPFAHNFFNADDPF